MNIKRIASFLLAILLVVAMLPDVGVIRVNAADDAQYPVPESSKELIDNGDGTYTLKLSVTGSAKSETTNPKVNVVFIMDRSGSMQFTTGQSGRPVAEYGRYGHVGTDYPQLYYQNGSSYSEVGNYDNHATVYTRSGSAGNYTYTQYSGPRYGSSVNNMRRDQVAIAAASELAYDLLSHNTAANPDTVEMAFVSFNDMGSPGNSSQWTTSTATAADVIRGYTYQNNTGTNWEDALIDAKTLADAKHTAQPNEQMFIIFLTDGNPTRYVNNAGNQAGSGQETDANIETCYNQAAPRALALTNAGYELYNIGVFGSVSRMEDLTEDANEATAAGHGSATYYAAANASALETAFEEILRSITNSLSLADVKFTDGVTDMTHSTGVNGTPDDFKYTITVNGEETPWAEAPAATVNANKQVIWDLSKDKNGNDLTIADGVTVTCSFIVWPDQDAMDLIADLNNKKVSYDSLTDKQKAQITGSEGNYSLKTNTEAKLDYSILVNNDGTISKVPQDPITLTPPDPMPLYIDKLDLEKKWDDTLDPSQREEVEGMVKLDFYKDNIKYVFPGAEDGIVLKEEENWKKQKFVSIATGIMVSEDSPAYDATKYQVITFNGKQYCILEAGHDYYFKEEAINSHFELTAYKYHPMLVDGKLHNFTFEKDADGNITGVIEGKEISQVSATNTIKGGVSITKKVVDPSGAEIDSDDPFTITMHMLTPEGQPYYYDYRIYYGEKNPEYESHIVLNDDGTVKYSRTDHIHGNGDATVTIYPGDEIRFVNVDADTRYYVEETAHDGYDLDGITYQIRFGSDPTLKDFTDEQKVNVDGKTYYLMEGNSSAAVVVTNKINKGNLKVSKTVVNGDTNKNFEFTLELKDESGEVLPGDYPYTVYKTSDDSKVSEGKIIATNRTFGLKDGQYIVIEDLPGGTKYSVTESEAAGYTITEKTGDTGTIEVNKTQNAAFTNTYDASGKAELEVIKALSGADWPEGKTLTFTLAGQGGTLPETKTVTLSKAEKATFAPITYGLADAGKTYTYTISEDGFGDGWTPSGAVTATVKISDNGDGTLKADITYSPESDTITNTYNASGDATIVVTKSVTGAAWPEGKSIKFTLEGASDSPMPEVTTATLSSAGSVSFGPISYALSDAGKTFTYTITEDGFGDGWTPVPESITAKVEVTDKGDGTLIANVTYTPENATLVNTYKATGKATLEAIKDIEGAAWPQNKTITFTLDGTGGTLPETKTVSLSAEGTAKFGDITYTEADAGKTYTYTITEDGFGAGWTGSPESITATVKVTDNGDGTLKTEVSYSPEAHTFKNTYKATGKATLEATKAIDGTVWPSGKTITFTLAGEGGTLPETKVVSLSAPGKATFGDITYTEADAGKSYVYTITENGFGDGWTADPGKIITAVVKITDNGDGTLKTEVTYSPNDAKITNIYKAKGEATLKATKALKGAGWPKDDEGNNKVLTFTLAGKGGTLPETTTATLTTQGTVTFDAIKYDETDIGEVYVYTITEDGFGAGWTADPGKVITATVKVTDNGDGTLKTDVSYSPEDDTITNIYKAEGEAVLEATKAIKGAEWPEDATIVFTLSGDGGTVPETNTVTLTKPGKVAFEAIKYTEADAGNTYTYTINENGFGTGWKGSPNSITATVKVIDNGDGTLKPEITYSPEDATFTNTYTATGEAEIVVEKKIAGAVWPAGKTLKITITGEEGAPMPEDTYAELTSQGKVNFGLIEYDESDAGKTYTYTVTEDGFGKGWTGAPEKITVKVKVTDKGDGTLATEVTYSPEDAIFTNTYVAEGEAILEVTKSVEGAGWPTGKSLTFTLAGEGGTLPETKTVTLTAEGKATFGAITYDESDIGKTYTYTITEGSFGDGWTGTPTEITATVKVTDNGDGTLKTEVTYDPEAKFVNTYEAEGEAVLEVTKALEGAGWPVGKTLTITLAGEGGTLPETKTVTLTAAGKATFGAIKYDESDIGKTYTYTITESSFGDGWTGTPATITATVKVTDNGDGKLNTEITYDPKEATFTNTYKATGTAVIEVKKALEGAGWPTGKTLTFTLDSTDGKLPEKKEVKLTAEGTATFGTITYNESDIGKTYTYVVSEDGFGTGWSGSGNVTATVEVTDNGNGTLGTKVTYSPDDATITNKYSADGKAEITVTKALAGAGWPEGKTLKFTLTGNNGAPMPSDGVTEKTLSAAGNVTFGEIKFKESDAGKTYTYTVTEDGFGKGWTKSDDITVTITVTDAGEGKLETEVTYTNNATITNTYAASGSAELEATKAIKGAEWPEGKTITFTLSGEGGKLPETKAITLTEAGKATFDAITYDESDVGKTYTYTISEDGFGTGWTGSGDVTATVKVTDNGDGTLKTEVTYSPSDATITNTYEASGSVKLEATKAIAGADWPNGGTITFTLSGEGGTLPEKKAVTLTAAGKATFDAITYDESNVGKTYTYTISEDGFGKGWTGSGNVTATVKVTDNGDGTLGTEVTYTNNGTIINTYEAEGEAVVEVTKALVGADWPAGKTLTFTLSGEGGTLPDTKTVTLTEPGKATFGAIKYDESDAGKTYTYTISEDGFGKGWSGSGDVTATVVVTDNGDGTLSTKVTYSPESDTITNTYKAEGSVVLEAEKELTGRDWKEGETFTFTLFGPDGKEIEDKTVTANGKIEFTALKYTQDDLIDPEGGYLKEKVLTYTISETSELPGGVEKSGDITATVTIKDNGDGTLNVTAEYSNNDKIINTYTTEPVEVELLVNKTLKGYLEGVETTFTFVMYDPEDDTNVIAKKELTVDKFDGTTATGSVSLYKKTYEEPGTYTYTLKEIAGTAAGMTYSEKEYAVTIEITDNLEGALVAKINKEEIKKTAFDFENQFGQESIDVTLTVTKKIEDESNSAEDKTFKFRLVDEDGEVVDEKDVTTEDLIGTVDFSKITYEAAGTYKYTLVEVIPEKVEEGWTYDEKEYEVEVTVTNNIEKAQLEAAVKIDGVETEDLVLTFTNKYKAAETKLVLSVNKEIEDTADPEYDGEYKAEFTFTLAGTDVPMPAGDGNKVTIVGEGKGEFGEITYDKAGEYKYTITETKGNAPGFEYDTTEYPVTVTVTDEGGKLKATPAYGEGDDTTTLTVTNKYSAKGEAVIEGLKVVEDKSGSAPDEEFSFVLKQDGETVETVKSKAGPFSFSKLNYTEVGEYTYTVEETKGTTNGFSYDEKVYTVTVKVTDPDKNGLLKTEVSYGEGNNKAEFTNPYEPKPTAATFKVTKVLEGDAEYLSEEVLPEFTFVLTEDGKVLDSVNVKGEGTAEFKSIAFTKVGEYNYTIYENTGDEDGFTYDTTTYQVKVTVSDEGGALKAAATVDGEATDTVEVEFVNSFEFAPVTYDPPVKKVLTGDTPPKDETFEFVMEAVTEGAPMPEGTDEDGTKTVSVTGEGETEFGDMTYTAPGTYEYTIYEVAGKAARYTYDTSTYTLTVDVTVEGTELVLTTTYVKNVEEEEPELAEEAVFVNRYEKEVPPPTDATTETRVWTGFSLATMLTAAGLMIIRRRREEE